MSREEFDRLESAAHRTIHLYLFVRLARFTGARAGAIQGLVWECVDFDRRLISFGGRGRQKGRAVVPMHPDLAWQLVLAKGAAETNYVIEWAGKQKSEVQILSLRPSFPPFIG